MTYSEKIINAETGEEIIREYTAAEIAEVEKAKAHAILENEKAADKEAARQAILKKLGLTAEEAAVLLG